MKKHPFSIKSLIIVAIIPAICLIPFTNKAFHADDTVFLWCAKQIQAHPADFYGFSANWYGSQQPMSLINQNPPLVSYYISGVASLFGWNEIILHIAFLVPAVCLSIGIYFLARFFCPLSYLAALITVLTPAFLVSSTNIMSDILMLDLYVWSAFLWLYGMEKDNILYFLYASILISLSALTKYFGMTLIPLLFVYSLVSKRKLGVWCLFLTIPIFILIGYQWLTLRLYNHALLFNAAVYAVATYVFKAGEAGQTALLFTKSITGLSFTGGSMAGVLFFTHLLWPRRVLIGGAMFLLLLIAALLSFGSESNIPLLNIRAVRYGLIIQYSLYVLIGIQILALAAADLFKYRNGKSILLFLWVFGTFFFSSYVNWTTNAKSILPMIPAVAILIIRRLNDRIEFASSPKAFLYIWPLIPAAVIALSVTWADVSLANTQRSAARMIHAKFVGYPHTIWFQGHWGFQYYMESFGAKALDFKNSVIKNGDVIIIPQNNTNTTSSLPQKRYHLVGKPQLMPCRWIGIMSKKNLTGFYDDLYGPLPFSIAIIEPEEYRIFLASNFKNSVQAIKYFGRQLKAGHF